MCIGNLTTSGSDNGLLPGRHQAIMRTNAGILLTSPLGTNLIEIYAFLLMTKHLKMLSAKWQPFCLSLDALKMDENVVTMKEYLKSIEKGTKMCSI